VSTIGRPLEMGRKPTLLPSAGLQRLPKRGDPGQLAGRARTAAGDHPIRLLVFSLLPPSSLLCREPGSSGSSSAVATIFPGIAGTLIFRNLRHNPPRSRQVA